MKLPIYLLAFLLSALASGQIFDQVLPLDQIIKNDTAYIVTTSGDTLKGRLISYQGGNKKLLEATVQDSELGIYSVTLRIATKEKINVPVDSITRLAIVPTLGMAQFDQTNMGGDLLELRRIMKDPTMKELLKDVTIQDFEANERWIYYETIKATFLDTKLFSSKWDFELRQLLNPAFSSRIKVYPQIDKEQSSDENSTEINGLKIANNQANAYIISVDGAPLRILRNLGYSRKAKEEIFNNCSIIDNKPQWKNLALDIFKQHLQCSGE